MTLLRLQGFTVHLAGKDVPVLAGVDLEMAAGEIVAVVGESGAGKTLLLKAISAALPLAARGAGICDIAEGRAVAVLQAPFAGLSPLHRIHQQIADVASGPGPDPDTLLERLGLPPGTGRNYPQELSGGMQMRCALARAMASGAGLILVDEPTAALDGPTARGVLDAIGRLRAAGRSVLMVTHDPAIAATVCDRIAVLHGGRLVETGPPEQILCRPAHPYTRSYGRALPCNTESLEQPEPVSGNAWPITAAPTFELRAATHLHSDGGGVSDINLSLAAGEILAVCGPSGSGKTTLARLAARLIAVQSGQILLDGQDIGLPSPSRFSRDPRRLAIQMVFQDSTASFPPWRRVRDSLPGADAVSLPEACQGAGLDPALLDRYPHQLSQGQMARAALVRATVGKPAVLVLDEPTAALDAVVQVGVLRHLASLARKGVAILLVTHDLHIARLLADRVAVVQAGRIVEQGPTRQVLENPAHEQTRALVAAMP